MDDPTELINRFCTEAEAARKELESKHAAPVDAVTLQSVLTERLGLSNSVFLIDQNLDKKRILEIVADHNFKTLVATVEMLVTGLVFLVAIEIYNKNKKG